MKDPEALTAKELQALLIDLYNKSSHSKDLQAMDMVNEMKQIISSYYELNRQK